MDYNIEAFFDIPVGEANDALAHHGVKGQKWGVRRTPAQLGHKPSGRNRSKTAEKGRKALSGLRKKKVTTKQVKRRKRADEFSDDELRKAVQRLQLEKQYTDLVKSIDAAYPKSKSRGRKFAEALMNQVVVPAAKEVGKEVVKQQMKKAAGLPLNEEKKKKDKD